jgi:hypothetical protein
MGYRTILSSPLRLTLRNTSAHRLVVSGATLPPGGTREVAGQVFVNDKFRAAELADLANGGYLQVLMNGLGFVNYLMSVDELIGLAATVQPQKPVKYVATVDLPANADVPVGYVAYDTTVGALVTNTGVAWV